MAQASNNYANILSTLEARVLSRIREGILLGYSDISLLANLAADKENDLLLCRQCSAGSKHTSPALSFLAQDGVLLPFNSTSEVDKTEDRIRHICSEIRDYQRSRHYELIGNIPLKDEECAALGQLLDLFYENSMIKINIDRDRSSKLAETIKSAIQKFKGDGLSALPNLVRSFTELSSVVVRVQSSRLLVHVTKNEFDFAGLLIQLLARHVGSSFDEASTSTSNWSRTSTEIAEAEIKYPPELRSLLNLHSRPSSPREALSPEWATIADVIHFGKTQFFEILEANQRDQILVIPIVFGEVSDDVRSPRPRFLLIVQSPDGIRKSDLFAIELIVHTYVHQRTVANRLQTLAAARRKIQDIPVRQIPSENISHSGLMKLFADYCNWICREVLEATPAHSMTVRIYDHAKRSLLVVGSAIDVDGSWQAASASGISVKENRFTSLNAFVFVNAASQSFPYAHLPRITAGGITTDQIPGNLQKLGLRSIMNVRPNTQAEICLPLRCDQVPIGTVNVEAPVPDVFNDHLNFLVAVRDSVEEAYEKTMGYNDIRTLARQIATHAAVHELDQHLELLPPLFNTEQTELLRRLFNLRSSTEVQQTDLGEWLEQWAKQAYCKQSDNTIQKIVNLVQIKSINCSRMSESQWAGVQFLVKNLIQNVVSHGSIEPGEGNSIIVDDRPLYGAGGHDLLRISSKQSAIRDKETLDRVCVAPIFSRSNGARYGMLLIGLITKTLGGQVFVGRDPSSSFTECLIRMPYAKPSV